MPRTVISNQCNETTANNSDSEESWPSDQADLNTCDFRVDSATICSRSLDLEVGLPRVQGHPVIDPQIESNGKRDPHRDFHFAESMRFTRIQEGIINLLDKPETNKL